MDNAKEGARSWASYAPLRAHARQLRAEGFSYRDIEKIMGVSRSTLHYWIRHVEMTEEQKSVHAERKREIRIRGMQTHMRRAHARIKANAQRARIEALLYRDDPLWVAGVSLYWAEGSKIKPWSTSVGVCFINTDVRMHKIFIAFLRKYCNVTSDRLAFSMYIHPNGDRDISRRYWAQELRIDADAIRIYNKKPNPHSKRKNNGDFYRGILICRVYKSSDLNRRLEIWYESMLTLVPHSGIV